MSKLTKGKKGDKMVGKGKVTPVQIAFIVDRYLSDNNYTNTLAAFRAEADDIFSKTKGKEAPKGLLGLGDILGEYISLKEQRVMVDQEKRRLETALQGIRQVMRAYLSSAPGQPPPLVPTQVLAATPTTPFFLPSNPSNGSPSVHGTALMDHTQLSMLLPKAAEPINFSTPTHTSSSVNKRKASKFAPKVPPAPKKSCTQPSVDSLMVHGQMPTSQVTFVSNTEQNIENFSAVQPTPIHDQTIKSPVQGSLVAKTLFKQQLECRASSSSPKTPPQEFPSQVDKSISPVENSTLYTTDAATSREIASANCSIISSETIIVSPLKQTGYYAIGRSYHITSPFNSSPKTLGKREHVKGRLHFDESDATTGLEKQVAASSSTSSTDEEITGTFDYDIPDLDIFNGDFLFTELLADIDLECEGIPCQSDAPADFIPRPEHNADNGCSETNKVLPGSCLSTVRVLSEGMSVQGPDSVTSVVTVTKCIKILSPAKVRGDCSLKETNSPAKA